MQMQPTLKISLQNGRIVVIPQYIRDRFPSSVASRMSRRTSASALSRDDSFRFTVWMARSASASGKLSVCRRAVFVVSPGMFVCTVHIFNGEIVLQKQVSDYRGKSRKRAVPIMERIIFKNIQECRYRVFLLAEHRKSVSRRTNKGPFTTGYTKSIDYISSKSEWHKFRN